MLIVTREFLERLLQRDEPFKAAGSTDSNLTPTSNPCQAKEGPAGGEWREGRTVSCVYRLARGVVTKQTIHQLQNRVNQKLKFCVCVVLDCENAIERKHPDQA